MKQTLFKANITAAGKYLPKKVLTNHDLEKLVETSDEWIQSRTGIRERRIVQNGEATAEMSTNAIRDLMDKHNLLPEEIDAIIIATITPDMMFPSSAALIQKNINAKNAWGYDLSAACSGFLFALESGAALIESGRCNKVIVVGCFGIILYVFQCFHPYRSIPGKYCICCKIPYFLIKWKNS